ncbi:MAG: primosomal protein N' [Ignavibacteria bacterium]|nr:primosomal protein N' [Ignavibacteria bacterium]
MDKFVKVALPIPAQTLFTYCVPKEMGNQDLIGKRVLVPLQNRYLTGVIVEESGQESIKGIKRIIEIFDDEAIFSQSLLNLTKWLSDYYYCSWGEALKAALPVGMSPQSVMKVEIEKALSFDEYEKLKKYAPKRAALYNLLLNSNSAITVDFLKKELNSENISIQLESMQLSGIIKCSKVLKKTVKEKFQKAYQIAEKIYKDELLLQQVMDELDKKSAKQSLVLSYLYLAKQSEDEPILLTQILRETKTSASIINSLKNKSYIEEIQIRVDRNLSSKQSESLSEKNELELELTEEQQSATDFIINRIRKNEIKAILLYGVTGSGKTLVYMRAIDYVIKHGKNALLLVPEISLTPQLIDRFKHNFKVEIAVLHSKLSQGERFDSWQNIYKGKSRIVIGARSAVFAPIKNLGLIIVDEEHETSYKQDEQQPRYQGRDLAVMRAKIENVPIILGSATPSIESMFNAKSGKYDLQKIEKRADGAKLPAISVIDLAIARTQKKLQKSFSDDLIDAVKLSLEKKEGIILFQNRRGFAPIVECADCGFVPSCRECSVTLTYHIHKNQLRCHYCGLTEKFSAICPICGSARYKEIGFGTQRIELELEEILKDLEIKPKIARVDLDTTSAKGSFRKILKQFQEGEIDIMIGTQMVAKGLDFARVSLVGVVNADLQLFIPDFRSSERTFQLITQVSGRAGRSAERKGNVFIQSYHPKNAAIDFAAQNNYFAFYENELKNRENALYPPFSRFVIIEFYSKDEDLVQEQAEFFAKILPKNEKAIISMGCLVPIVYKIRNQYRRFVIIKNIKKYDANSRKLKLVLDYAFGEFKKKFKMSTVKIKIDVDSYSSI